MGIGEVIAIARRLAVMFLRLKASRKETAMTNKIFTIWRAILITGMVIGVAGIVGEMVWSAEKGKSKAEEARQVIGAELEKRGEKTIWSVEILTTEETIIAVSVDAVSGSVLMSEEKAAVRRPTPGKVS